MDGIIHPSTINMLSDYCSSNLGWEGYMVIYSLGCGVDCALMCYWSLYKFVVNLADKKENQRPINQPTLNAILIH